MVAVAAFIGRRRSVVPAASATANSAAGGGGARPAVVAAVAVHHHHHCPLLILVVGGVGAMSFFSVLARLTRIVHHRRNDGSKELYDSNASKQVIVSCALVHLRV